MSPNGTRSDQAETKRAGNRRARRRPRWRRRVLALAVALQLGAAGCDDPSTGEPPPPRALPRPRSEPAKSPPAPVAPVASPVSTTSVAHPPVPASAAPEVPTVQPADGTGLAEGGYLATQPRPAVDGTPFALPDPLPEVSRPVACDVAPPALDLAHPPIVRVIGSKGTAPGCFAYLRAIAAARDGSAYYVVDKNGRLQALDSALHVRAVARTPEIDRGRPTGLFVAANGELWVSDTHYARVLVYGPDLSLRRAWGSPGTQPGTFLFLRDAKELEPGRIVTADYGDDIARLQIFSREGQVARAFGRFGPEPGEFSRPMKVAVDRARGELWVADSVNHRLQVLDLEGKPLATMGGLGEGRGRLKYPYDVVLDEEGRAWVAEFGNHRIQVFDRQGRSLATWGKAGRGEGQVAFPWGLALEPATPEHARILVIDSGNDRIYELDRRAILAAGAAEPAGGH